eukprot:GFYU01000869.1.p1 GENE.GFYU01000869.1~~GFYU01000869.1.p1  ORF type:complete len:1276 (-),score=480.86 GFYU01000869.1:86-3913(-)
MASIGYNLERMSAEDPDLRYMATNDVLAEVVKPSFRIDSETERKLCMLLLQQLEDSTGDVQALAVKCLAPISQKAHDVQVEMICDKLCDSILQGNEAQRDISSITLKTIVNGLGGSQSQNQQSGAETAFGTAAATTSSNNVQRAALVTKRITPRLLAGISRTESDQHSVQLECLEILQDTVRKFGSELQDKHDKLIQPLLALLNSTKQPIRKRASVCLASLAPHLSDPLFKQLIESFISKLKGSTKSEHIRSCIQSVANISHSTGSRLGPHLQQILPMLNSYLSVEEQDDEVREYCFQSFESFVLKCSKEMTSHLPQLVETCIKFLKFDPNYVDDDEDEEEEGDDPMDMDDDDDGFDDDDDDDDSGGGYSDDEDFSWKVRRAAAKCLSAVISTRPEMLAVFYQKACKDIITRFKDREETVKLDVFQTFVDLIKQTAIVAKATDGTAAEIQEITALRSHVPQLLKSTATQLKEKSVKTRVGVFQLLKEVVIVVPDAFGSGVAALLPGVQKALTDKASTSTLKIVTLQFLIQLLRNHQPRLMQDTKVLGGLLPSVVTCVEDKYYKITSEALKVCCEVVRVLRPINTATGEVDSSFDFAPYVDDLYKVTYKHLISQDQDQEVKEHNITCVGLLITHLGDKLGDRVAECLDVLHQRLANEITRLVAVKTFATIAASPLKINMGAVTAGTTSEIASFLKKSNRPLRQASLVTLNALVKHYATNMTPELYQQIAVELTPLISNSDLHLTHLSLSLCVSLLGNNANLGTVIQQNLLPQVTQLLQSSILQGQPLKSVIALLCGLLKVVSYDSIMQMLLGITPDSSSKASYTCLAQCVGAVTVAQAGIAGNNAPIETTLASFMKNVESNAPNALMSLLSVGEIGRQFDVVQAKLTADYVQTTLMKAFESASEEIKSAASYALGNVAAGSLTTFLPLIIKSVEAQTNRQYLLLHALKETISKQSRDAASISLMAPFVQQVLKVLLEFSESDEEGIRNVVGECLGKLAAVDSDAITPVLKEALTHTSPKRRSTAITALKFTITDENSAIDHLLKNHMASFIASLKDTDVNVRRSAMFTLNCIAHNKLYLIRDTLTDLLPILYHEAKPNAELIRQVDLGPFKHTVDDGLDLRKATFECMDTLLDCCLHQLDLNEFVMELIGGLTDHYDIRLLCHLMISKLCSLTPLIVLGMLDRMVGPLEQTIKQENKANAVKQEIERNEDMIRSAMRVLVTLSKINNVDTCPPFVELTTATIPQNPALQEKYDAIKKESEGGYISAASIVEDPMVM